MESEGAQDHSRGRGLVLLALVFALGAALRVASINTRSFWLDETTSVRQASWPLGEMVAWMAHNVHPPLFHTLLHYWIGAFTSSEISVRGFALIWGLAAIPLAYWVGSVLFERRVGLFSAGIVALSPFFIWYSQEARMYTMLLVFALLATGAFWRALRHGGARWWLLYALAAGAGLVTQYFFAFLIAGHLVYYALHEMPDALRAAREAGTERSRRGPLRLLADVPTLGPLLLSAVVALIPLGVWLPYVFQHPELLRGVSGAFNYGGVPPELGVHFDSQALVLAEGLFGFHAEDVMRSLVAAWPLLVTGAFVVGGLARRATRRTQFLIVSAVTGLGAISLLGMWQPIVLEVRYFTAVCVPLVILIAKGFCDLRPTVMRGVLAVVLVVAAVAWVDQSYNPDSVTKWDNRAAMGIVADGYHPGDVILLLPYFVSSVPQYYLPPNVYAQVQPLPLFDRYGKERNSTTQLAEDLTRKVGYARRVWVIATWQETPQIALDRQHVGEWLTSQRYRVAGDHQLHRIRVTLYEGQPQGDFFLRGRVAP
jgi:uncharacterized membrane protein